MAWLERNEISQTRFMRLHEKLTAITKGLRLSQRDLASALPGVSTTTINRWLNGESEPRLRDALRIARALHVDLAYLADDELDEVPSPALTEDELRILWLVRASGLNADDAARALINAKSSIGDKAVATTIHPGGQIVPNYAERTAAAESARKRKGAG